MSQDKDEKKPNHLQARPREPEVRVHRPESKADAKPDAKPDAKAEPKAAANADAKAEPKAAAKADAKPEASAVATSDKAPEPKTDPQAPRKGDTQAPRKGDPQAPRKGDTQAPRKSETGLPGKRLFVDATLHAIDALDAEAVAIGLCSDVRPLAGAAGYIDWRLCGRLSDLLRKGTVTGVAGEKVLVPTHGMIPAHRIFLFGWGEKRALLDNAVARMRWMAEVLKEAGVERVAVALPEPANILVGLVEEHLRRPLGDKLALVFGPDELMGDTKDTRPIPAAPPG